MNMKNDHVGERLNNPELLQIQSRAVTELREFSEKQRGPLCHETF